MKKKISLLLLFCLSTVLSFSQTSSFAVANKLKKTTLMVVIEDEESTYTQILKTSLEKYWTHTKFEFIKSDEVEKYISDENYSLLMSLKYVDSEKDKTANDYTFSIILGDENTKEIKDAKIIKSILIPGKWNRKTGMKMLEYEYLLPFFIQNLESQIALDLKKISYKTILKKGINYYNNGLEILPKKTILIYKDAVKKDFDLEIFCDNLNIDYNKARLVSKEELMKVIEDRDDRYAIVYDVDYAADIFDAKTGLIIIECAAQ